MPARLQKLLAGYGYGSRREIETWISAGRIMVNGAVAKLGQQVSEQDQISLDQRHLSLSPSPGSNRVRVMALNKPAGWVCTRADHQGRPTVFENLPELQQQRWVNIGRLDINTTGLLLFTNDGDLANRLMHPSFRIEREYAVRVLGEVRPEHLKKLRSGVFLDNKRARFSDIVEGGGKGANKWFYVVLMEGRNREVRRLWESQGVTVSRLIRVRYGSYIMPKNKHLGEHWELTTRERRQLVSG